MPTFAALDSQSVPVKQLVNRFNQLPIVLDAVKRLPRQLGKLSLDREPDGSLQPMKLPVQIGQSLRRFLAVLLAHEGGCQEFFDSSGVGPVERTCKTSKRPVLADGPKVSEQTDSMQKLKKVSKLAMD